MPKIKDLTNQRFGNLIAIKRTKSSSHGYYWLCQCDCGKQKEILGTNLTSQNTKSCGCQIGKNSNNHFDKKDLSNQQFGFWTVLYATNKQNSSGNYYWHCRCKCGVEREVLSGSLLSGKSKSCGCVKSYGEERLTSLLKNNNISFEKEYSFIDCLTENNHPCRFDFAIFDNNQLQCLIEYDGKQHFEEGPFDLTKNQYRDKIKNNYCLINNIPLYRIPYMDLDTICNLSDIFNTKYLLSRNLEKSS